MKGADIMKKKKTANRKARREALTARLCLLPASVGLVVLTYVPLIVSFILGFFKWSSITKPSFVGFDNYIRLFTKDPYFKDSIWVTVVFSVMAVIGSIVYSLIIAMLLNRKIPARGFLRAVFYLPYVLPSLAVISVWLSGNLIVIFLAGLQNVPRVYHEAAEIDGANGFQRFLHVTLPCMSPIIFYNLLMSLITNLQIINPALALTNGGPGTSSTFISFLMYRYAFKDNQMGYASAISFIFFIIIALFTAVVFATSKKWVFYEGGEES